MKEFKMSELRMLALSLPAVMVALLPITSSIYVSSTDAIYDFASYMQGWLW